MFMVDRLQDKVRLHVRMHSPVTNLFAAELSKERLTYRLRILKRGYCCLPVQWKLQRVALVHIQSMLLRR